MSNLPKIKEIREIAASRLFKIQEIDLVFSNGEERCYERVAGNRTRGAVLIVPLLNNQTFLLVREYMVGIERYGLAFPKGLIEGEEDILTAANREMSEEVGYKANKLTYLRSLATSPGYLVGQMPIILAEDLYPEASEGDEPEPIEVVPWELQNVEQLVQQEDFIEARSIAAIYLTLLHLQKN